MTAPCVPSAGTHAGAVAGAASATSPVGWVHSWDIATGVDGPGTRFTAFLAGCPLRCVYCHNPDTWTRRSATATTVDELLARIGRYRRFLEVSGGGVTLSGGEPLAQPAFVSALVARLAADGYHVALDTSGHLGAAVGDRFLTDLSLVLLDVKSGDDVTHRKVTGGRLEPTLVFARRLAELAVPVWVRFVVVPGWTDAPGNVARVARIAADLGNVERVDVLPFHRLGAAKYEALGLPYRVGAVDPPTPAVLDRVRDQFTAVGLRAI